MLAYEGWGFGTGLVPTILFTFLVICFAIDGLSRLFRKRGK